ncbi:MAG: hypothetical protein NTX07_08265 [Solirubrobacterales bacterium]|nr:hypothetical protein [Solirubrobacterales bacterium]
MNEQEKTQAPSNAAPANADVAIKETNDAVVEETAGGALPIGLPPFGKIFYGALAILATALLWTGAGNLKQQACIETAQAQYGANTPPKSLATLGRKNAVARCSNSPF